MIIIGEKINGTRPVVAQAIAARDAKIIRSLAQKQAEAGAHYLDINAGTHPDDEPRDLLWLVDTVQSAVDLPLCLDSANPDALARALPATRKTALINSISGETSRLEKILPLAKQHNSLLIALLLDKKGVPRKVSERLAIATNIIQATRAFGIADENVFFDPLTLTLAVDNNAGKTALQTMRTIREHFPNAQLCVGLSNISFDLPYRSHFNRAYLTLALSAGLDAAILDPLDAQLLITLLAAQAVLGEDKAVVKFIRTLRDDRL